MRFGGRRWRRCREVLEGTKFVAFGALVVAFGKAEL